MQDLTKYRNLLWQYNDLKCDRTTSGSKGEAISCVQFDISGDFIAIGDRSGKIGVYRASSEDSDSEYSNYKHYCTFVSHESEFDYLKSLEIEEKINKIRWLPHQCVSKHLLSTNDKTIKLWRLTERPRQASFGGSSVTRRKAESPAATENEDGDTEMKLESSQAGANGDLRIPSLGAGGDAAAQVVSAQCRRVFANAHAFHINSISVNSDQETFLSADDLRINLWNLNVTNQSFTILDIKPANMEDLSEVITAAEFDPVSCNLFMYSSSKGVLRLCDMRQRALCDECAVTFRDLAFSGSRSFFSEIVNSITDLKFSNNDRYVLTRDYLTLKVWDIAMPTGPVETYDVHNYLRDKFVSLYENDCIFDRFECAWSPDNRYVMTGSYNNLFRVFNRHSKRNTTNEVESSVFSEGRCSGQPVRPREVVTDSVLPTFADTSELYLDSVDFNSKLLYVTWHPRLPHAVALASNDALFLLSGRVEDTLSEEEEERLKQLQEDAELRMDDTDEDVDALAKGQSGTGTV